MEQHELIARLEALLPQLDDFHRKAVECRIRWLRQARPAQLPPTEDYATWVVCAGRGFGKTKCGAEDAAAYGMLNDGVRIAVVAPTSADVRDTCFEGDSGLLSIIPEELVETYNRSMGELVLKNGSRYKGFSADAPERLRGPQHHRAWCDEIAGWDPAKMQLTWDMLQFGLRLGDNPQAVCTTTPKPVPLVYDLVADPTTVLTRGSTYDNKANLAPKFLKQVQRYEGTELGRQEIHAELLDLAAGAILKRKWWRTWTKRKLPEVERVVISYDTAFKVGKKSDQTAMTAWGLFRNEYEVEEKHPFLPGRTIRRNRSEYGVLLLDAWQRKLPFPDLRETVVAEYDKWGGDGDEDDEKPLVLIEDKGSGQSLVQELDRAGVRCQAWNPGQDSKLLRAHLVSDILKDGKVWCIGRPNKETGTRDGDLFPDWTEDVVKQLERFTGAEGASDDYVDSCGQAWAWFRDNGFLTKDSDRFFDGIDPDDEDGGADRDSHGVKEPIYA